MAAITCLNLGKTMEKKLHSVGIDSAEELLAVGSKQAVSRLKTHYPSTCVVILYHLEAAIRGVEIKRLDDDCTSELKAFFNQLCYTGQLLKQQTKQPPHVITPAKAIPLCLMVTHPDSYVK